MINKLEESKIKSDILVKKEMALKKELEQLQKKIILKDQSFKEL